MPDGSKMGLRMKRLKEQDRLIPRPEVRMRPHPIAGRPPQQFVRNPDDWKNFHELLSPHVGKELTPAQWADLNTIKWKKYIAGALKQNVDVKLVLTDATPPVVKELLFVELGSAGLTANTMYHAKGFVAPWDRSRGQFVLS